MQIDIFEVIFLVSIEKTRSRFSVIDSITKSNRNEESPFNNTFSRIFQTIIRNMQLKRYN